MDGYQCVIVIGNREHLQVLQGGSTTDIVDEEQLIRGMQDRKLSVDLDYWETNATLRGESLWAFLPIGSVAKLPTLRKKDMVIMCLVDKDEIEATKVTDIFSFLHKEIQCVLIVSEEVNDSSWQTQQVLLREQLRKRGQVLSWQANKDIAYYMAKLQQSIVKDAKEQKLSQPGRSMGFRHLSWLLTCVVAICALALLLSHKVEKGVIDSVCDYLGADSSNADRAEMLCGAFCTEDQLHTNLVCRDLCLPQ